MPPEGLTVCVTSYGVDHLILNGQVSRVGNLSPTMGARNQGCRTGPPAIVAWLLNSRLGSWNRFLAP
jgi:hypothetical protein